MRGSCQNRNNEHCNHNGQPTCCPYNAQYNGNGIYKTNSLRRHFVSSTNVVGYFSFAWSIQCSTTGLLEVLTLTKLTINKTEMAFRSRGCTVLLQPRICKVKGDFLSYLLMRFNKIRCLEIMQDSERQ